MLSRSLKSGYPGGVPSRAFSFCSFGESLEDQYQRILGLSVHALEVNARLPGSPPCSDFDPRKDATHGYHLEHHPTAKC
jgi:hypothetical protein